MCARERAAKFMFLDDDPYAIDTTAVREEEDQRILQQIMCAVQRARRLSYYVKRKKINRRMTNNWLTF